MVPEDIKSFTFSSQCKVWAERIIPFRNPKNGMVAVII